LDEESKILEIELERMMYGILDFDYPPIPI